MTGAFIVKKLAIWHAIAPTYSATTVTIMDMLPWIAQIRCCHLVHQHAAGLAPMIRHGRSSSRCHNHTRCSHHDYKDRSRFSHSQSCPSNHRYRISSCQDPCRSPQSSRSFHRPSYPTVSHCPGHRSSSLVVSTTTATTHLTADLHLIGILPEMTADLDINPGSNTTDWPKDPHPPCRHHLGNIRIRDTSKSPLMTHHQSTTAQMTMTVTQRMI